MPRLSVRPEIRLATYRHLVGAAIANGQPLETYVGGLLEALVCLRSLDLTTAATRPLNDDAPLSQQSSRGASGVLDASIAHSTSNA
jgi:hypothetical protein